MFWESTTATASGARILSPAIGAVVLALSLFASNGTHAQTVTIDPNSKNTGSLVNGLQFGGKRLAPSGTVSGPHHIPTGVQSLPSGEGIASNRSLSGNSFGLDLYTFSQPRLSITAQGLVGIGFTSPTKALEIHSGGDVELGLESKDSGGRLWTLQSSGSADQTTEGTFQIFDRLANRSRLQIDSSGTVSVDTLRIKGGSDLAEPFATGTTIAEGSVVSIDERHPGRLKLSERAYDRRVAGIVSGANGVSPGLTLDQIGQDAGSQQVALTGRVYAMADDSNGQIEPGDMLTTSEKPGRVMKATNLWKARGAVIGKAMSAIDPRTGMVLVLVSLQ